MVNKQLDLKWKEHMSNVLSKKMGFSEQSKDLAFRIWDFVYEQYTSFSPSSISICHQCDGTVSIKCDNSVYYNIDFSSYDKELLHIISIIAESSNIEGKMFLYSPKNLLNELDFTF